MMVILIGVIVVVLFDFEIDDFCFIIVQGRKKNKKNVLLIWGKKEYLFMIGGILECFLKEEIFVLNFEGILQIFFGWKG